MWEFIVPLLIKYGIPLAINILEKTGAINEAESLIVKGFIAAKDIKTYQEYPTGKNGDESKPTPTPNNLNKG